MTNIGLINQYDINGGGGTPPNNIVADDSFLSFGNLSICWKDGIFTINGNGIYNLWEVNIPNAPRPLQNGSFLFNHLLQSKSLTLDLALTGNTRADVEQKFFRIKNELYLSRVLSIKVVDEAYSLVWYTSDISDVSIENNYCTFSITIYTGDAIRKTSGVQTIELQNITINTTWYIDVDSYYNTRPEIIFVFNSWSITELYAKINDWFVEISENINAWDIVTIDVNNQQVMINGVNTDYNGASSGMILKPWQNLVDFQFTGTYDITAVILYTKTSV